MKVLVTGSAGQVGYDVCQRLDSLRIENRGVDLSDFDITDAETVSRYIRAYQPDAVIHCAAYTNVNRAETEAALCRKVNAEGTRNIAAACREADSVMVYLSTDYVFGGEGEQPFETDAPKAPKMIYGATKSEGEDAVRALLTRYFIVRTSWVFGIHGGNFVRTMTRLGREKDSIDVVCDQIGSPTYSVDLARLLCDMIQTDLYGVYHATNEGDCSWYSFACEIMRMAGLPARIRPVASDEYPQPVRRPLNSRLSKRSLDKAGFKRLPTWRSALERFLPLLLKEGEKSC